MSSVFSIALSSLQAESEAINTTGHNLANINTNGFKQSNVNFRDLVAASLGGNSLGLGVATPVAQQIFSQGAISSSTSPWAAAIQGNGFFVLKQSAGPQAYTRNGNFTLSKTGELQTLTGENVQGWTATPSGINATVPPSDITLNMGSTVPPNPTSTLSFTANLNAAGDPVTGSGNMSVPVQVTDSLGNQHTLTINFTKNTSANTWDYGVTIPSSDLAAGIGTNTTLVSGTMSFNSDGTLTTASLAPITIPVAGLKDSANDLSINWSLKNADGSGMITQFAQSSAYNDLTQDGSAAGKLTDVGLGDNGQIIAKFSNGQQKTVAQLAMATFRNQNSLQDIGNNNFAATGNTAQPDIGLSQTGNRGQIVSGALEGSNVDMAKEFTNLITFQRGYQASSKVITTADNMSQDLLSIIR
ncbi:MAG: flagellar hook protein FlgE [Bryobacteraceae bacterium]